MSLLWGGRALLLTMQRLPAALPADPAVLRWAAPAAGATTPTFPLCLSQCTIRSSSLSTPEPVLLAEVLPGRVPARLHRCLAKGGRGSVHAHATTTK